ncbi:MAG: TM0106 family RecB-like putative nuclease [Polyangiaceae bacterium]
MKHHAGTLQLTATDVANLSACRHLVTLDVSVLLGKRARPNTYSAVTTRLIQLGEAHERAYLDKLKSAGRTVLELPAKLDADTAVARTHEAMRTGADVIYQGALRGDGWYGRTDFLIRVETPSPHLGAYSYEVVDTKLSRAAKGRALLQLCLYSKLLEEAQGSLPAAMHIVLGDSTQQSFATQNYLAYFRRAAAEVRNAVHADVDAGEVAPLSNDAPPPSYPSPIEHCDICHWQSDCEKQLRDDDDLSLVAGLTSAQRAILREAGTTTLEELGSLDPSVTVDGISSATFVRIREQASIQSKGRKAKRPLYELLDETEADRGLLMLPEPSPGDLFVDLEGDPLAMEGGIEYLIGVIEAGPERGRFTAFWGTSRAEEKRAFEAFMAFVKERRALDPNLHIYHYAPYEPAAFKRLAARHNTCEAELDELLQGRVFVDLYRAIRQGVRASVESYSIKKLEPLYGFTRKANLKDAGSCLVAMATWFDRRLTEEPDAELKATIAAYNEDDCTSTLALRDWLEARRAELEAKSGKAFDRPAPGKTVTEEQAARDAEVEAVADALTASLPEAEGDWTTDQRATWLLAQLLNWHRREDKSVWWEYHRLRRLSDAELTEESGAIGQLTYDRNMGKEKQSILHRYRFPEQDYTLKEGTSVIDPRTEKSPGHIHAIDDAAGTIVLKRGRKVDEMPHPTSIFEHDLVPSTQQRQSLLRLGKWVAKNGIDSQRKEHRAERALLRRMPPLLPDGTSIAGARTSEELVAVGKLLARTIDGSVLAVQGPPGAGKSHLGAEMIVELVRSGNRVGIVANSHKVIGNLLKKACEAAERANLKLPCIQKESDEHKGDSVHPFVKLAENNPDVIDAIAAGAKVVAGTSWLWSREDMKDAVDVLFVDEAGQLSLANVLACAQAANGLVLLGDPQQLNQPIKGVHPAGADASALGHVLGEKKTLDADSGIFLAETWRMHPDVCSYISDAFYDSKLEARADLAKQRVNAEGLFDGVGLRLVKVEHRGNTNASVEEATRIGALVQELLASGATWTDKYGSVASITAKDVLVITPYNAQITELRRHLPEGVAVGTVDKFQGQEAPISIYSLASSTPEDAPRGMEFLYSKNRLNVALSRARCVSVVVASPALFTVRCKTPRQMELANAFCRLWEICDA